MGSFADSFQKQAYILGVQKAWEEALQKEAKDKDSWLSRWAPWLATGVGLGTFGILRHPFKADPSKFPILRRIQDLARGNMLRAGIEGAPEGKPGLLRRLGRSIIYGPETWEGSRVPRAVASKSGKPTAVFSGYEKRPPRGTFDPSLGPVTGPEATRKFNYFKRLEDKLRQARFMEKHMPGLMPRTVGLEELAQKYKIKLTPANLQTELPRLQAAAKEELGGGYVIKPRAPRRGGDWSANSLGQFATNKTNLAKEYEQWLKIREPYKKYMRLPEKSQVAAKIEKQYGDFRLAPGYKGRLVDEMLHNNVVFQKKIPVKGEIRLHIVGDKAVPALTQSRYNVGLAHGRRAAAWAQKNIVPNLPKKAKGISYAVDLAPDAKGGYKVIELNPGGGSGFLDFPVIGNPPLYRTITGRSTPGMAAIGGLAAGGAAAGTLGLANALRSRGDRDKNPTT